jgi:DNA-binding MarR family transcriptional regulator
MDSETLRLRLLEDRFILKRLDAMLRHAEANFSYATAQMLEFVGQEHPDLLPRGLRVSDVAKAFEISIPTATEALGKLVDWQLVKRDVDPFDARSDFFTVTEDGRLWINDFDEYRKKILTDMATNKTWWSSI